MKLLIVDDQNSVHMFLDKMLESHTVGISGVFHAYNGKEALVLLEREKPDIMLLDVKMPVMDGLETLRQINAAGIQVRTIILSAYNEFEYARKALLFHVKDYLLKPIDWEELSDKLRMLICQAREDAVSAIQERVGDYLNGQKVASRDFALSFEKLDIKGYGFLCSRSGEGIKLPDEIPAQMICACSSEDLNMSLIRTEVSGVWDALREHFCREDALFIGFSLYQERPEQAPEAMRQSIEALKQGFYEPGTYRYEPDVFSQTSSQLEMELAGRIQDAYLNGDVQNVKLLVERLFTLFRRTKTPPQYIQEFCYSFLLHLNKDFITTFQQLKGSSFTSEFNYYDAASLKNALLRMIINMQCDFEPEEASTDSDVVCRIKQYIDLHYNQDLSLETMSKHFFIGKYQISRIFKKKFEINYSDYILKVRMENAALLLTATSCKLYEIAHKTGFEETSYFSNVFKKYYGVTPNEYRKMEESS